MLLQGFAHPDLISREIALVLAEMVFKRVYGEDDFKMQQPLTISDDDDRWMIVGNRRSEEPSTQTGNLLDGPVEMIVLKRNGQIVKLVRHARFPAP